MTSLRLMFAGGTRGRKRERERRGGWREEVEQTTEAHSCWKWETALFAQPPSFEARSNDKWEEMRTESCSCTPLKHRDTHHHHVTTIRCFLSRADPGEVNHAIIQVCLGGLKKKRLQVQAEMSNWTKKSTEITSRFKPRHIVIYNLRMNWFTFC